MKYTFYICGGEGSASRGEREDSFKVVKMDLSSIEDVDWVVAWVSDNEYDFDTWEEFKSYMLEQDVSADELISEIDPGFGTPFVYGVKDSSGKLIRDWDFENIEEERLGIDDDVERKVDPSYNTTSKNKKLQSFALQNGFVKMGPSAYGIVTDDDLQIDLFDFGDNTFQFTVHKYSAFDQKPIKTLKVNSVEEIISLVKKYI